MGIIRTDFSGLHCNWIEFEIKVNEKIKQKNPDENIATKQFTCKTVGYLLSILDPTNYWIKKNGSRNNWRVIRQPTFPFNSDQIEEMLAGRKLTKAENKKKKQRQKIYRKIQSSTIFMENTMTQFSWSCHDFTIERQIDTHDQQHIFRSHVP